MHYRYLSNLYPYIYNELTPPEILRLVGGDFPGKSPNMRLVVVEQLHKRENLYLKMAGISSLLYTGIHLIEQNPDKFKICMRPPACL